jgi:DNA replication protein DnaC
MIPKSRIEAINALIKQNAWPLYFFGMSGRGKSYTAAQVFAEWPYVMRRDIVIIDFEQEPIFWKANDILGEIADARFRNQGVQKIRQKCQNASLVVLDDIADRSATDARRAALYDLIEWRKDLPLILTGNFPPNELHDILKDDRVISRIQHGRQVKFGGPDLRLSNLPILEV